MRAHFTATPESLRTVAHIASTSRHFKKNADKAVEVIAKETVRIVKALIESQNFATVPLNPKWVVRKRQHGWDPRNLIATREYLDGIDVKRIKLGNWAVTCDAVKAKRLEYGTPTMKPRPHWAPVILAMEQAAPIIFAREVLKEMGLA